MLFIRLFIFFLAGMPFFAWPVHAASPDPAREISPAEAHAGSLDRILRVAVIDLDIPPFVYRVNKELQGADVDLIRGFARSAGFRPVFVSGGNTYDQVVETVARGGADMGISELSKTMSRARKVFFSRPYLVSGITLLVNRLTEARLDSHLPARDPEGRQDNRKFLLQTLNSPRHSVATMEGSFQDDLMQRFFSGAEAVSTSNWLQAGKMVVNGQADAAILPDRVHLLMLQQNPEAEYKTRAVSLIPDHLVIAVNLDKPELLRLINDYLDITSHWRETHISGLMREYMNLSPVEAEQVQTPSRQGKAFPADEETYPLWLVLTAIYAVSLFLFWGLVVRRDRKKHWLLSPWAVLLGLILGSVTGSLIGSPVNFAGPLAGLFIRFWQLCVLPIMITAVVTSIFRLFNDGARTGLVRRLVPVMGAALLSVAFMGVLLGSLGRPGADFPAEAQEVLLENIDQSGLMDTPSERGTFEQLMDMARSIVPGNVLEPVLNNQALGVLFLALFFGIMLTRCRPESRQTVVNFLDAVQGVFTGMVRVSLYVLPLALYLLTLDFTSRMGLEMFKAITGLAGLMVLGLMPPLIFGLVALKTRLKLSLGQVLNRFTPMAFMAFSTRSSVVSMPLGLEAFDSLASKSSSGSAGPDKNQIMASFPLFLMACHCGFTLFFCLIPLFIAQVFGVEFTAAQYLFLVFGAALSALASTGAMAMSHVLLLPIVCEPLGLPVEPAFIAGYSLLTIMSPVSAAVQTLFSSGLTAVTAVYHD